MLEVSVVIPTFNRKERLAQTLSGLERQDFPMDQFEVVVVSDGSSDGTAEFLQSFTPEFSFKYLIQENQGAAVARNQGVKLASSKIILFIDDDIVPSSNLISEHFKWHMKCGENAVIIGPMLTPSGYIMSPWITWEQTLLLKYYQAMITKRYEPTPRQFYTGNASLARQYLIESGGFDPIFRRAEDVELAYRLQERGLLFYFNPDAIGYHFAERSYNSWIDTAYSYGKNDVIFSHQKGQIWLLPRIFYEFYERHLLIRGLVSICLGRPLLYKAALWSLKNAIFFGEKLQNNKLSLSACSAIFNLRYYQGVSDQMGGRKIFYTDLRRAQQRGGSHV